jgi:hypothetical protein
LKKVAGDKVEYEKYLSFKRTHTFTKEYLRSLSLDKLIEVTRGVLGNKTELFERGLAARERSENKVCKIAKYLQTTPYQVAEKEIEESRMNRPSLQAACLRDGNLESDF